MMINKLLCLLAILALFSGCALFEGDSDRGMMEKTSEELASEGASAFYDGEYEEAIKAYTDLKDWYPFSKYAILAELKIADSYYELEEYEQARFAYEEFEKLHPRNEAVPYVIYQMGMSWFSRISTVDRDHTPAKKSLELFRRLNNQFPDNEYAAKTPKRIQACLDNMSGHELYVAKYYLKQEEFKSALKRLEYLMEHYPNSKESKEAVKMIPELRRLVKKN